MFLQCLIAFFIILLIVDRWKPKNYLKLHQRLGNNFTYWPILGNALNFIGSNEDMMDTLVNLSLQAYEKVHKTASAWIGNNVFVVISDADQAVVVLKSALEKKYLHNFIKDLAGNGTIFAPVKFWHRRRKILVPTFAPKYVNKFVTIFEAQSKIAAELIQSRIGKGNFSCFDYFCPNALGSVCETLFGVNVDVQRQTDHSFLNAFTDWCKNIAARLCQPWLHIDIIYKLLPISVKQEHNVKIIHRFIDRLISKKKALMDEDDGKIDKTNKQEECDTAPNTSKPDYKTFLELMIKNSKETDKGYTDDELREESIVVALAGTDTSAVATSFAFLLLSQHQDVQERVYKEIQEVLGDSDKPLHAEDLLKLKYTRAVIKETLRLYPPVPFITRYCKSDLELPSGLVLPKGCNAIVSIWGIQRNPYHWGEDANYFNPDRFMSEQILKPNAFMAFSHSSRNCVGQQYAMLSMTTTLVILLRQFRFTPATNFNYDEHNPLRLSLDLTVKHSDQFTVQVDRRNN